MNILFIGTSSGITEPGRFPSSILIQTQNHELLVDCGDGFSQALLNQNLSFTQNINSIIITHFHPDHLAGLPSLLIQMKLAGRTKPLTILVYHGLLLSLKKMLNIFNIFPETYPFDITFFALKEGLPKLDGGLEIKIKINTHIKPKQNAVIYDKVEFVSFSLLIIKNDKKVVYTSDIGSINDLYLFNDNMVNCFITEISHISVEEFIKACEFIKTEEIVITHYQTKALEEIFDNEYISKRIEEKRIITAYDGLNLSIR
ncbi:MAG: MBL fold metallo-hydrolase [bacterium]